MKERLQSFFHHSSTASRGITVLLLLLSLLLLVTAFTMRYFVPVSSSLKEDTALSRFWAEYRDRHSEVKLTSTDADAATALFRFDPNTLDSIGFIKLGLRPVTTRLLLNWRRKGKVFRKKEELKKLYTLSEAEYDRLAPYIAINAVSATAATYNYNSPGNGYDKEPGPIDINLTDSATLVRLKGIGPYFAHKLIERRDALGGYISYEQLKEAYKFKDSTYHMLKEKLVIRPQAIRKINVNTASEERLKRHPYIGEKMAKNIVLYRQALKQFEKIEQLRQAPLMNEEIYRKIAPYLSIE